MEVAFFCRRFENIAVFVFKTPCGLSSGVSPFICMLCNVLLAYLNGFTLAKAEREFYCTQTVGFWQIHLVNICYRTCKYLEIIYDGHQVVIHFMAVFFIYVVGMLVNHNGFRWG